MVSTPNNDDFCFEKAIVETNYISNYYSEILFKKL